MKRIYTILFTFILLLFLIVSCTPETPAKTIKEPGENETTIEETLNYSPLTDAGEDITLASSESEMEYFFEIAFGTEYGASQSLLHKWTNNIRIKVNDTPTSADLDTLNQVVTELNSLVDSNSLQIVDQNPNIDIHFTPMDQFKSIIPSYLDGNMGYFLYGGMRRGPYIMRVFLLLQKD